MIIKYCSLLFTDSINIQKLHLKENNFYQVECILNNKKDNITDISSYPFKKINKIKRKIAYDQYGRFFINDELFFPFGIYAVGISERELRLINQTHLNIVKSIYQYSKEYMDIIYSTKPEGIKIIYGLNISYIRYSELSPEQKEECRKNYIRDKVNEIKDHPALFAWYINDEGSYRYNEGFRSISLTIHEFDPDHPSYSVVYPSEMPFLLNTTDIIGSDPYPIGFGQEISYVNVVLKDEFEKALGNQIFQLFKFLIGQFIIKLFQENQSHLLYRK